MLLHHIDLRIITGAIGALVGVGQGYLESQVSGAIVPLGTGEWSH
jgi:hypothetical protein